MTSLALLCTCTQKSCDIKQFSAITMENLAGELELAYWPDMTRLWLPGGRIPEWVSGGAPLTFLSLT